MCAGGFAQGRLLSAGDQNQPGTTAIGQRIDGGLILFPLFFQASQRAKARSIAFTFFQKVTSCTGQLQ